MSKQKFSIHCGRIPCAVDIRVAGQLMCQAIYLGGENVQYDPIWIPKTVRKAVLNHFQTLYSHGAEWIEKNFDSAFQNVCVGFVEMSAAKNVPGSLVDIKIGDSWVSGYYVQAIHKTEKTCSIDVKTAMGVKTVSINAQLVRKSKRV